MVIKQSTKNEALRRTRASIRKIEEIWALKRKAVIKGGCGLLLMLTGCTFFGIDPIAVGVRYSMHMVEGSKTYETWKKPPLESYVYVRVFNVTNHDAFLKGVDSKLKIVEVGPFTYLETRTNTNLTIDYKSGKLSFIPRVTIEFISNKSIGNPKDFKIIVPNLPLLSIASLASEVGFLAKMGLNMLISNAQPQPILNITVHELLWGYDDPLVRMAHTMFPGWIDFKKFGILDRVYRYKEEIVQVELNDPLKKYSLTSWDGEEGLRQWGYSSTTSSYCNQLNGTYEGIFFPQNMDPNKTIRLYRKQMCRAVDIKHTDEKLNDLGVRLLKFEPSSDTFSHNSDQLCMCKNKKCLPVGVSDVSPCYYDLPVALSWPHFLDGDAVLFEKIDGLSPNREEHGSRMFIEPKYGLPMELISSTQSNAIFKDVSFVSMLKPFSNIIYPILWMKMELETIKPDDRIMLQWVYCYGPAIQTGLNIILILSGLILLLYQMHKYRNPWWNFRSPKMEYNNMLPNFQGTEMKSKSLVHQNPLLDFIDQ